MQLLWHFGAVVAAAVVVVWLYGLNIGHRWRTRHLPGPRPAWLVGASVPPPGSAAMLVCRQQPAKADPGAPFLFGSFQTKNGVWAQSSLVVRVPISNPPPASVPPPLPPAGNVMQMGPQGKIHEALQKWAAKYGPVFKYFLGRRPCIVITGEAPRAARCGLLPRPGASAASYTGAVLPRRTTPAGAGPAARSADPDLVRQICVKRFIDYHDRSVVSPPRSTGGIPTAWLAPHAAGRRADRSVGRQSRDPCSGPASGLHR